MTVEITCPNCNFSKSVPTEKIPEGVRYATCPRCGNRFEFNPVTPEFDLEAGGDYRKERAGASTPPWESRPDLGTWQAVYRTFKSVLSSPGQFFGGMKAGDGIGEPFAFGLLLGSLGTMFGLFWQFLFLSGKSAAFDNALSGHFKIQLIFIAILIISPIFVIFSMFITGGIIHLCLLIVRGSREGFKGTFRVIAYSQATSVLSFIPFIGGLIGSIWHIIVLIAGLKGIHGTSYIRVIIALLLPFAFIFLLVAAIVIIVFFLL